MLRDDGATARVKSGVTGAFTASVIVVECVADAAVPVTVTAYVPTGVLVSVTMVSTAPLPASAAGGANEAVAPAGRPLAVKVMVSAVPRVSAVVTFEVVLPPCTTL